ncbi:MAG: hypothetical protein QOE26_1889 [Verrucomicrobiota bacterium]|jgi:hypothetical protein
MSTRRADPDKPLAQERYASARTTDVLLGNLVAKKCEIVTSPEHRRLILFLHDLSTRSGCRHHPTANLFPAWPIGDPRLSGSAFDRVAEDLPSLFPARIKSSDRIADFLTSLCLDPKCDPATAILPGCRNVIDLLEAYREKFCAAESRAVAATEATSIIWSTLDYALSQGGMVLIEGTWRVGKSFSAQAWAQKHVGECRYVQLSSGRDDTTFYRDIARCLGTAHSTQIVASKMRARIEAMLRTQSLLLILDEAQFIWPQSPRYQVAPQRVNWLITALLNSGVTIALIASHDFTRLLRNVEERCAVFGSEQFHGRLRHRVQLPNALNESDLASVARAIMPEATARTIMLLVGHALKSKGRIAAIESAVTRARFFAARESRSIATFADVDAALVEAGSASPVSRDALAESPRLRGERTAGRLVFSEGGRIEPADRRRAALR